MIQLAGLVVEYLIIGLVSSVWILIVLLILVQFELRLDTSLLIFTPLLYVFGMISDYLGSILLRRWEDRIERNILNKEGINNETFSSGSLNAHLIVYCPDLSKALELRASRYRIARGVFVNVPLIGLSLIWLLSVLQANPLSLYAIIITSSLTIFLCVVVLMMWAKFQEYYIKYEVHALKVLKEVLKRKKIRFVDST